MAQDKIKFALWIPAELQEQIRERYPRDNCRSQSEFIEKAIRFYMGYLSGRDACNFLPEALVGALQGSVQQGESHICRLLFKLTVELSIMMNVLAAGMEISPEDLDKLRARCVREVKRTNGSITMKDAVRYQSGLED